MTISVVTVVRNAESIIRETIESVLEQSINTFEYLIIDGLSSDRTYEIVCGYDNAFRERGIKFTHISEKDAGVYDAMNKAAHIAEGRFINYMNAGDCFHDADVLKCVEENIERNELAGVFYGDTIVLTEQGEILVKAREINTVLKHMPFYHQACFTNRLLLMDNLYNCSYKIVADYDLYLRLYEKQYTFIKMDQTICKYRIGGISMEHPYKTYCENVEVKIQHGIIRGSSLKQLLSNFYYKNLFIEEMPFHKLATCFQRRRQHNQ